MMAPPICLLVVLLGAILPLLFISPATDAREVGVSYGRVANDLPDPASVAKLLQRSGISMVRLYDANPDVLRAFANTGIKVQVMLPNEGVGAAAASPQFAFQWMQRNVAAHHPATRITGVAVGTEVFVQRPELTRQLVPAMANVHRALERLGLAHAVKVSTPIHFSALRDTFPPSSARFRDDIAQSVMQPMMEFLMRTGSYLSVNPYPFFAYAQDPRNIDLDYALGNYKPGVRDSNTGLVYHSLLDAMMDATFYATEKLMGRLNTRQKPNGINTQWTETGWPSGGGIRGGSSLEAGDGSQPATAANAMAYNNYLINRVLSGETGTPHRPDADMDVYIFALFNENQKGRGSDDVERQFGLFYPNMTKVYGFDFRGGGAPTESWCVANVAAGDARLQAALDYACGHGAILPGGGCFAPITKVAYASYAFNSYYQSKGRASGTCDFDGAASIVFQQPRFGNCVLPSNSWIQETGASSEGYAAI